nr:hypothetical protein [Pontibacter harenae]
MGKRELMKRTNGAKLPYSLTSVNQNIPSKEYLYWGCLLQLDLSDNFRVIMPPLLPCLGGEKLQLSFQAVAVVELWFQGSDVVFFQLQHFLLIVVLLQADYRLFRALSFVFNHAPKDVARLPYINALTRLENKVKEV